MSSARRQFTKNVCRERLNERFLSHLVVTIKAMDAALIDQAIELLEKANAGLEPELLSRDTARRLLASYARARRLVDFGIAGLSRKLDDAARSRASPGPRWEPPRPWGQPARRCLTPTS